MTRLRSMVLIALALCLMLPAQHVEAQTPSTDIFLAPLTRVRDSLVVGRAVNITRRAGYDNQPSFTANSRAILYTVQSDGQTDIWRYELRSRATSQVTRSGESEYSATPIPGQRRFSVIRVEQDSTQRLWSFAMDGSDPRLVLSELKPVGYHAWLDSTHLITFVLGTPATLHAISRDGSGDVVKAHDIGRALNVVPGHMGHHYTFTQRDSGARTLSVMEGSMHEPTKRLAPASPDNEYHVVDSKGRLLTTVNGVLVRWSAADSAWHPLADLKAANVRNVTRLALSPDGKWLAFVAEPIVP